MAAPTSSTTSPDTQTESDGLRRPPVGIMSPKPNPKDPWPDPPELPPLSDEALEVRRNRYREAKRAGLSIVEAEIFSSNGVDVGQLRRLVTKGCPVALIREIVL